MIDNKTARTLAVSSRLGTLNSVVRTLQSVYAKFPDAVETISESGTIYTSQTVDNLETANYSYLIENGKIYRRKVIELRTGRGGANKIKIYGVQATYVGMDEVCELLNKNSK